MLYFRSVSLKLVSLIVALLFAAQTVFAADNAAVLGNWNIELSFQGQSVTIALGITQGANGLEGTWTGPQGSTALSDVSFDGETLKFNRSGPQGQMTMAFKVAGDTISGTLNTPGGELPVTGKRSS